MGQEHKTPLYYVTWNGQRECIEILIQNGADVNLKDVGIFVFFLIWTNTQKSRGEESDWMKEKRKRRRCERRRELKKKYLSVFLFFVFYFFELS